MDAISKREATEQQFQRRQMNNRAKNQRIQAIADELSYADVEGFANTYPGELVAHMFTNCDIPLRDAILRLMFDKHFGPGFREHCIEALMQEEVYAPHLAQFKRAIARHKLEVDLT